jgi:hypothetical protein
VLDPVAVGTEGDQPFQSLDFVPVVELPDLVAFYGPFFSPAATNLTQELGFPIASASE